jgi:hypothetical protein
MQFYKHIALALFHLKVLLTWVSTARYNAEDTQHQQQYPAVQKTPRTFLQQSNTTDTEDFL